ncbi:MAG TPA: DMT family transporter [Alphaproteobacteria bacterium]|nr:DMT family transporter [Alphaproteobacteria bacterium]
MVSLERAAPAKAGRAGALRASRLALLALFVGGVAVASSGIFIKLSELPPTATVFHRLFLSAPFLWLWSRWERPRSGLFRPPQGLRDYGELAAAGALFAINAAAWSWCMKYTTVANGSLIANMSPIFVSLGAWVFLRERFSRAFLLGMLLALLGAAALMGGSASMGGEHLTGDFLALTAALFWGGYLLMLQRLRRRFTTATIMTWTSISAAAMLLAASAANGERLIPATAEGWGAILGLALVAQVAGQSLITFALAQLPASFSSVGLLIQPVYAALGAWLVLGEVPEMLQAVGGGVVLGGIVIARRGVR